MIADFANREIVLASASPRRVDLLRQIGIEPIVFPVNVKEDEQLDSSNPGRLACANAELKARAAYEINPVPGSIIIGADTIVVQKGRLFGKPADEAEAAWMLSTLSGQPHDVYTGICLIDAASGKTVYGSRRTAVHFAKLSDQEIEQYVATGEPLDKAGAYGIQGIGGLLVEEIAGDYGAVVGLSLPLLKKLARMLFY